MSPPQCCQATITAIFLFLATARCSSASPLPSPSLVSHVVRSLSSSRDTFILADCERRTNSSSNRETCHELGALLADDNNNNGGGEKERKKSDCRCECTSERPIWLHSRQKCVARIDDCESSISAHANDSFPVLEFNGTRLNVLGPVLEDGGAEACSLNEAFVDVSSGWKRLSEDGHVHLQRGHIALNLSDDELGSLRGSVVLFRLSCERITEEICLVFRLEGNSSAWSVMRPPSWSVTSSVALLFVLMAFAVCVGSCLFVQLLWHARQQKMVRAIRAEMARQLFLEHERQRLATRPHAAAVGSPSSSPRSKTESVPVFQRRKLIFSPEYLEPDQMASPSQPAEQFLVDLRQIIDMAKARCRAQLLGNAQRAGRLDSIAEEDAQFYECYMSRRFSAPVKSSSSPTASLKSSASAKEPQTSNASSNAAADSGRDSVNTSDEDDQSEPPRLHAAVAPPTLPESTAPHSRSSRIPLRWPPTPRRTSRLPVSTTTASEMSRTPPLPRSSIPVAMVSIASSPAQRTPSSSNTKDDKTQSDSRKPSLPH